MSIPMKQTSGTTIRAGCRTLGIEMPCATASVSVVRNMSTRKKAAQPAATSNSVSGPSRPRWNETMHNRTTPDSETHPTLKIRSVIGLVRSDRNITAVAASHSTEAPLSDVNSET